MREHHHTPQPPLHWHFFDKTSGKALVRQFADVEALKPARFAFCAKPSESRLEPSALVPSSSLPTAMDAVRSELSKCTKGSARRGRQPAPCCKQCWQSPLGLGGPASEFSFPSEVEKEAWAGCVSWGSPAQGPSACPHHSPYFRAVFAWSGGRECVCREVTSTPAHLAEFGFALLGVPESLLAFLSFPGMVHGL